MQETVVDRVRSAIAERPQATAFVFQGHDLSYRQLGGLMNAATRDLLAQGIGQGQTVGVRLRQSPLNCVAVLALLRLGALVVPLRDDPKLPGQALQFARLGIGAALVDEDLPAEAGLRTVPFETVRAAADEPDPMADFRSGPGLPAMLALSSGTTGVPKGVLYSHADLVRRIERTVFDLGPQVRFLPPMLHVPVAIIAALGTLASGGTVVFPDSYDFPGLADAIRRHGVTHLFLTPVAASAFAASLPESSFRDQPAFPSLRHLRLMGTTAPAQLLAALRRRCSPNLYTPYATTELGVLSMATPALLAAAPGAAGQVMPWVRLEIVDTAGRPVPAGTSGEIRVAAPAMPQEYYRAPELSRAQFRDGWFYPGDIGHLSAQGLLYLEARVDDVINVGGHKVLPSRIEEVLLRHPQVQEAAAFELKSADGSSLPVAAVVASSSPADLAIYCERELGVLSPRRIFLLPQLPRNDMGKVVRAELQKMVASAASGAANPTGKLH